MRKNLKRACNYCKEIPTKIYFDVFFGGNVHVWACDKKSCRTKAQIKINRKINALRQSINPRMDTK